MKILLASAERFSGCIVDAVEQSGHKVIGVVSPYRGVFKRQFKHPLFWLAELRGWDILKTCRRRVIDFRLSRRLADGAISAFIKNKKPDVLILFGWPSLIEERTLSLFPWGGLNIHPSLLPKLRGADPLFNILDQGLDGFGITIHKTIAELDAGPIYFQKSLPNSPRTTYDRLYLKLLYAIHKYVPRALENLFHHPEGKPQDGVPTYAAPFKQALRALDPDASLNSSIRRTRACYSHHTRVTSCEGALIHFSRCRPCTFQGSLPESATILKTGLGGMVVCLGGRAAHLSGIRFARQPRWKTSWLLKRICKPGRQLGSATATRALMRQTRKKNRAATLSSGG